MTETFLFIVWFRYSSMSFWKAEHLNHSDAIATCELKFNVARHRAIFIELLAKVSQKWGSWSMFPSVAISEPTIMARKYF